LLVKRDQLLKEAENTIYAAKNVQTKVAEEMTYVESLKRSLKKREEALDSKKMEVQRGWESISKKIALLNIEERRIKMIEQRVNQVIVDNHVQEKIKQVL